MSRFVLDTDHLSLLQHKHLAILQRIAMLPQDDLAITVVTAEEQLRGWLNVIRQNAHTDRQIWGYQGLEDTIQRMSQLVVLPFDRAAYDGFVQLRQQRIRIGSQDLRIASIVLSIGATLLTRNQRDFAQVPGLATEDWTAPSST